MLRARGGTPAIGSPSNAIEPPSIVLEPGDGAQQRGLAAARRPDEDAELAFLDVEVDAAQGVHLAVIFLQALDGEARHRLSP